MAALATDDETGATRVLLALLGVLSFIVGLYALRHILVTIATLALLLGIFWIVNGAVEVFTALSHRRMSGRGWTIFMGLLSVVAGVVVLVYPGTMGRMDEGAQRRGDYCHGSMSHYANSRSSRAATIPHVPT